MMKNKKALYIIGGIVLLLAILNPSSKDFGEYIGGYYYNKKAANWLIFSVYVHKGDRGQKQTYIGMVKNFFLYDEDYTGVFINH